ncbi:MAG: hypothetical protein ACREQ8_03800 [Woeseiaceae bacterium]
MRRLVIFIVFVICSSIVTVAADKQEQAECAKLDRQIREIQEKMRHGYSASQGEKLKDRLRELRARRAKVCH